MTPQARDALRQTAEASEAGQLHFGEVVARLVAAGVDAYQVDYRAGRTTYYGDDDDTLTLDTGRPESPIAPAFDPSALVAAIRGAQRGDVMYPAFRRLAQAAGCVGYVVWIGGRHVAYHGRGGERHVEWFPD